MQTFLSDLRFAVRTLRKNPSFALIAIATLGLGMGATTTLFSVLNGILVEPLPYREPDRLVLIGHQYRGSLELKTGVSARGFLFYRDEQRSFSTTAGISDFDANYSGGEEPTRLIGQSVSRDYFTTVGVALIRGRAFTAEEEQPGADKVVILAEAVWRRLFGADPAVVGTSIQINGEGHLVVGIAERGLALDRDQIEIFKPLAIDPKQLACWGCENMAMIGRLKPEVTLARARADLDLVADRVREVTGGQMGFQFGLWTNRVADEIVGDSRSPLLVLMAAVALVLLIACANVANLLLTRASGRRREVAVRTAMGATRGRLIRQLVTESGLIAIGGGIVGLGLTVVAIRAVHAIDPTSLPRVASIGIDGRVLGFTGALVLATPLLFGLLPAAHSTRADLFGLVKDGTRGSAEGLGRFNVRSALVVIEVALALVLLVGAGLMLRSVRTWLGVDPGFRSDSVLTFQMAVPRAKYPAAERALFVERLRTEIGMIPGVERVGATVGLPMSGFNWTRTFEVEGYVVAKDARPPWGEFRLVTPGLIEALGIDVIDGRAFDDRDGATGRPVAMVDADLAARYWPGQSPVGKRVGLARGDSVEWREVVGVVAHIVSASPRADRRTQLYLPYPQQPNAFLLQFAVKSPREEAGLVRDIRAVLRRIDPTQPIFAVRPMTSLLATSSADQRFLSLTLGAFAALALLLAAIGVFGVMAFAVAQATKELGIRIALGAAAHSVRGLILARVGVLAGLGTVIGLAGGWAFSRVLAGQLYQVAPSDPATMIGAVLVLMAAALVAGWLPARRATRVDPIVALRAD